MATPQHPLSEEALSFWNYFESAGATLLFNQQFFNDYAFDFSIVRYENLYAHVNLAIHVTTVHDDIDAMERFVNGANRGICLKALYVEIDPSTVNTGSQVVGFGAALNFLFQRPADEHRCYGIRIFQDCSLQYFNLENNISRLNRLANLDDLAIGDTFKGKITHYFTDRGFGFIQIDTDHKFFLHIANIADDRLRTKLAEYSVGEVIPVEFQFGGSDGGKYPKAINIVLDEPSTE